MDKNDALFEFLCRMGDNTLILGHRISEWCGHAPVLEEDIGLSNHALDMIGQTQLWLGLAGEIEGKGRDADKLAFLRDAWDFRNVLLVERPNGHFGQTMMRQFFFDAWHSIMLTRLLKSSDARIAEIAEKALKEVTYHLEKSADIVVRLGDGSAESHAKMQKCLDDIWTWTGEMFLDDQVDEILSAEGIIPKASSLKDEWDVLVKRVMAEATLTIPDNNYAHKGGKTGTHTEHLGFILADMQFLQRAYPGASW